MSDTRDSLLLWLVHEHGFALEVPFGGRSGKRKWRWDAALGRVAVEYQGIGAGHSWHKEQAKDHEKYNEGMLCGWTIILANAHNVNDGSIFDWIDAAVELYGEEEADAPADPGVLGAAHPESQPGDQSDRE